jgi:hypothetical protein
MEIRKRAGSGIRTIALLVVSITITGAILAAMLIDTVAPASLSASTPLPCTKTVQPVLNTLEFVRDCKTEVVRRP